MVKFIVGKTFEPKHITGDNDKGHYDFWSVNVISEDRLISVAGTEDYVKSIQSGDTLEGNLEEKPYTDKDGNEKMSYRFKRPKRDVYAELDDLTSRILVLEAFMGEEDTQKKVAEIDDDPGISDEDIPF